MKKLHPKIVELKKRAAPVTYSQLSVDIKGDLKIDDTDLENRVIKGYLIVWGVRDTFGTKFVKGCCARSIQQRGPQSDSKYKITFLWQHRQDDPLSLFDELEEDDYGLRFKTKPLDDVANADRAIKQIRSGTINQFSVGFNYNWDKMEYDTTDDSLVLLEVDLYEGSIVTIGSNAETHAIRSGEQLDVAMLDLNDDTEEFIKSIPRKQQLELRNIIARHKSLCAIDPLEVRQTALGDNNANPVEAGIGDDISFLLNTNLKIF